MAKKLSDVADDHDQQLAQAVRTSAQQIWQAGLGAFVKAQQEEGAGQAGGEQAFQRLVRKAACCSSGCAPAARPMSQDDGADVTAAAEGAGRSWDKLEQVFEDRVVRALGAIGVPSKRDLDALAAQVARLSEQVAALQARLEQEG